jgi:hypothetical protein
VVRWNGSDRPTTYVSASQLTAAITAADIASASMASVTVFNPGTGGGTSNAVSFVVGTLLKEYLPLALKAYPPAAPTGPNPGFWQHPDGRAEFYVTADRAFVDDFAIRVNIDGCGSYKITHNPPEPISGKNFVFSGPFYASGTFNSQTTASGSTGLDDFYIAGCGYITGGPWAWTADWKHSAQQLRAEAVGSERVEPASPSEVFEAARTR